MAHSASDFSNWVYRIRHPNKPNVLVDRDGEKRRALGVLDHDAIELIKKRTFLKINKKINTTEWGLYYADDAHRGNTFFSKKLSIDGKPLVGRPDVVFSHKRMDYFIVVERKITSVPSDIQYLHIFEPAQCQLWAYSWLDELSHAKDVLLILEIWERFRGGIRAADMVSWRRSNDKHHGHCLELFERYASRHHIGS